MKKSTKSSKTKPAQLTLLNPKCAGIDVASIVDHYKKCAKSDDIKESN